MYFIKDDGTHFEMRVVKYKQKFLINFDLKALSNGTFRSIDRGINTDRYSTSLTFEDETDNINEMIRELKLLRDNNKEVIINECEERIFSDNIDHTIPLNTLVFKMGGQKSTGLHTQSLVIELLLSDPTYLSGNTLPSDLECLQAGWEGYSNWNTHVNETYNGENYFVDRVADVFVFNGSYIFNLEDTKSIINYWSTIRGNSFTINDGDFGVVEMFGADGGTGTHDIIITRLTYANMGPELREVKIELVKVG